MRRKDCLKSAAGNGAPGSSLVQGWREHQMLTSHKMRRSLKRVEIASSSLGPHRGAPLHLPVAHHCPARGLPGLLADRKASLQEPLLRSEGGREHPLPAPGDPVQTCWRTSGLSQGRTLILYLGKSWTTRCRCPWLIMLRLLRKPDR